MIVLFRRVGLGPCEGNVLEAWLGGPSVLAGPRFGAFQLYILVGFKGDVRPLGGPGGAPARPSGGWG